jgi:hypothetical protein
MSVAPIIVVSRSLTSSIFNFPCDDSSCVGVVVDAMGWASGACLLTLQRHTTNDDGARAEIERPRDRPLVANLKISDESAPKSRFTMLCGRGCQTGDDSKQLSCDW